MKCTKCKKRFKKAEISYVDGQIICQRCFKLRKILKRRKRQTASVQRRYDKRCLKCDKLLFTQNVSGYCRDHIWEAYNEEKVKMEDGDEE